MTEIVFISVVTLLGLAVGTMATTVIMRMPYGRPLARAPYCPACELRLRWRDQMPVLSWLLLRGRCRECGAALGWRYPAIEVITAILFGVMAWRIGPEPELVAYLYLVTIGVCLSAIDLDVHRLPDLLTLPSYAALAGLLAIASTLNGDWWAFTRALICAVALFGTYYLLALAIPNGMGFGDVKFAGVLGLALGFAGWSVALSGVILGFFLGGIVSAVLLLFGWVKHHTRLAFGPFMLAGALVALVIGDDKAGFIFGLSIS